MKITLLFALSLFLQMAQSQDTIVKYFNSDWEEVKKEEADYFRKAFSSKGRSWKVFDYYIDGQLQMTGTFATGKIKKKDGYFEYFYKNGTMKSHGIYKKDKRNGEWKWYRENAALSSIEKYKKDKLKEFSFWDEQGKQIQGEIELFEHAQFVGGPEALAKFISDNVSYPEIAQENGVSGRVYVSFIINKEGSTEEVGIERSANRDLDNEAMRVIRSMPKWIPGKKHNLPVRVSYTVPINFVLE